MCIYKYLYAYLYISKCTHNKNTHTTNVPVITDLMHSLSHSTDDFKLWSRDYNRSELPRDRSVPYTSTQVSICRKLCRLSMYAVPSSLPSVVFVVVSEI